MSNITNKEDRVQFHQLTSQRNAQIVISKKFSVKKGDVIKYDYNRNEDGEILDANLFINDEFISKMLTEELQEFIELTIQSPY